MTWQVRRLISAPVVTRVGGRDSGQQPLATGAPQGVQNPQAVVGQRPAVSAVRAADIDLPASPKAGIATYRPSGERDWMFSFENTWLRRWRGRGGKRCTRTRPARCRGNCHPPASPPATPAPRRVIWRRSELSRLTMKRSKMPMPRLKTICAVRRPDGVEVAVGGAGHRKVFTRGRVSDQDAAIDE